MREILEHYDTLHLALLGGLILLVIIQIIYWSGIGKISRHRHKFRLPKDQPPPPVSVVVILEEGQADWLYSGLPRLLEQDHPNFEVVIVNDCGGKDISDPLEMIAANNPKVRFTEIKADAKFKSKRKIALLVGIKAARNENIVFTQSDCTPASRKWLSFIARGFVGSELVISYCRMQTEGGFSGSLIRASNLMDSLHFLRGAIRGKAYSGTKNNLGYTKTLFFNNRGFNYPQMTQGEDDLLIQKIATPLNTAVIINPHAATIQDAPFTLGQWRAYRRYKNQTLRLYPKGFKFRSSLEPLCREMLFAVVIVMLILGTLELTEAGFSMESNSLAWTLFTGATLALWALREWMLMRSLKKACTRLGEAGLGWTLFIYDKLSPLNLRLRWLRSMLPKRSKKI